MSSGRLGIVRQFLTNNEIFFKTVAATLLSAMALIVAVAQSLTAQQQLQLSTLQTNIAKANALPNFDFAVSYVQNPDSGTYDSTEVVVTNSGGPIHELQADSMLVLHAEGGPPGRMGQAVVVELPVNGYYDVQVTSPRSKGNLLHFIGRNNNADIVDAEKKARALADARRWGFLNIDDHCFVHLEYMDLLGQRHDEYFAVSPVRGSRRLAAPEIAKLKKQWTYPMAERAKLNPERILDAVTAEAKRLDASGR